MNSMDMTKIDLDSIFNEEWYQNITQAAIYTFMHLNVDKTVRDQLALRIVDYNIEKRLKEVLLSDIINTLPKTINWKNKQITTAFREFKDIIDSCDICPALDEYKVKILLDKNSKILRYFEEWKNLTNEHYPTLNISILKTKDPNAVYLKIIRNNPIG